MEENVVKFQEKLKNLVALAKKKKNILEIQEINDAFRDMELEPTQMDKVFEYLEANGIDVLQMNDDSNVDDDDLEIMLSDEDEVDMEKIDLSVPDGISIEDPVHMYLKEIGKVPLLSAEEEIELAKRMADGDEEAKKASCRSQPATGSQHCKALRGTWYAVSGSYTGRKPWTYQSGREV